MRHSIWHWRYYIRTPLGCLISVVGLLLLLIMFCTGLVRLNMLYNDIRTGRFMNLLFDYPLPPQTKVVYREALYFRPINGGTCVFSVSQVQVTSLSQEQIERYYKPVSFPRLRQRSGSYLSQTVNIDLTFNNKMSEEEQMQFTVSIGEAFFDGGFDPRCDTGAVEPSIVYVLREGIDPR